MSWLPDGVSAIFQDFGPLDLYRNMRVPKISCTILGVPIRKDYSIQGSILGSPYLRKLPYPCGLNSGTASSAAAFMHPQALIPKTESFRFEPQTLRVLRQELL